jgi:hypothetical protein
MFNNSSARGAASIEPTAGESLISNLHQHRTYFGPIMLNLRRTSALHKFKHAPCKEAAQAGTVS